ncbi:type I-E CRISPR-associated protein Cas5/CasD (plasmid) [Tistrella mobilis]|uniref:type I-E CRISPR-associated protein Cas5/CasD n=1 Tax=Tistrella mobilis TaxID=171437 RepID=UPI003556C958
MTPAGHDWLVLRLEAPMVAFGGVAIDQVGVTRDFPAASMLTGLIGNALGWHRTDTARHQNLQDRLIFAARRDAEPVPARLTDMQNAQLGKTDRGWTTWGQPEGRDGASYAAPHRRQRDYLADLCVTVVLRLADRPEDRGPGADSLPIEEIEAAFHRPARPLFIGRKPCLPVGPIAQGRVKAATAHAALGCVPAVYTSGDCRALWPVGDGPSDRPDADRVVALADLRNWLTGLHGGTRMVVEGRVTAQMAPAAVQQGGAP